MNATDQTDGPTSQYIKNTLSSPIYPIEFFFTNIKLSQKELYAVLQQQNFPLIIICI